MRSDLSSFFSKHSKLLACCFLFVVVLSTFLELLCTQNDKSVLSKGDFPAFYSAAKIISAGDVRRLYDFSEQRRIQNLYWPSLAGNYHAFVYPASFAFVLSPLASFSANTAKFIYLFLQLLFFIFAFFLARSYLPLLRQYFFEALIFGITFLPLYTSIISGQNTALSLFLFSSLLYFLNKGGSKNKVIAGFIVGLWFFKPQYPLLILPLIILKKEWKMLAACIFAAMLHFLLSSLVYGAGFFQAWQGALNSFLPIETEVNSYQMISIIGVSRALSVSFQIPYLESFAFVLAGLIYLFFLLRLSNSEKELGISSILALPFCFFLISPHSLFYDLGLLILPFLYFFNPKNVLDQYFLIGFFLLSAFFSISRESFIFSPFVFLLLTSFVWISNKIINKEGFN